MDELIDDDIDGDSSSSSSGSMKRVLEILHEINPNSKTTESDVRLKLQELKVKLMEGVETN